MPRVRRAESVALALDLCANNIQDHARSNGLPWAVCKGLDTFSPIGRFVACSEIPDAHNVCLKLEVCTVTYDRSSPTVDES